MDKEISIHFYNPKVVDTVMKINFSHWFRLSPSILSAFNLSRRCEDPKLFRNLRTMRKFSLHKKYTEPVSQEGLNYRDAVSMVFLTRRSQEPVAMRGPLWRTHHQMEPLLSKNYTSRWPSKYLVRLPAVLVEHRDDLWNKNETTYCQIS